MWGGANPIQSIYRDRERDALSLWPIEHDSSLVQFILEAIRGGDLLLQASEVDKAVYIVAALELRKRGEFLVGDFHHRSILLRFGGAGENVFEDHE